MESELFLLQSKDGKVTDYTERISEQFVTQFRTYQDDLNEQLISPLSGNLTRYQFKCSGYGRPISASSCKCGIGELSLFAVSIFISLSNTGIIVIVGQLIIFSLISMKNVMSLSIKYT